MHSVIVLDDEAAFAESVARFLEREGYEVEAFTDAGAALECLKRRPCDLLITDLNLPDVDGLGVLDRARRIRPHCEVLMMTGYGTVEIAVQALKRGAVDFLTKPFELRERLLPLVREILAAPDGGVASDALARRPCAKPPATEIVGASAGMLALVEKLPRIARSESPVLLHGESGTGKEVVADEIHRLSPRCDGPLVKVNCASIPEALFESELFGHRKGAFTGADRDREGLIQRAHRGTLFLDELGELPQSMQAKLLRVLQDGQFRRVGENELQRADFRLVAATNRDLRQLDRRGHLRSDLYYRVAVIQLELPPLRDRREDIEPLAHAFASRLAPARGLEFTPACRAALTAHTWPGNVRELRNAIEHALVLADGATIDVEHLPVAVQEVALAGAATPARASRFEQMEIESILRAMQRTGGCQTDAAALLGVTRRTLGYRIAKYGLQQRIEEQQPRRRVAKVPVANGRWDSQTA